MKHSKSGIEISIDVDVSAERLWDVVGNNFGEVAEITSVLNASHLEGKLEVGGARVCINPQNQRIVEKLTVFDPTTYRLAYDGVDGFPSWVTKASNHWVVEDSDESKSRLIMQPDIQLRWYFKPIWPLMRLGVRAIIKKFAEEVKYYAETGKRHPRVVKHHAKLAARGGGKTQSA